MARLLLTDDGRDLSLIDGESVLDALTRSGIVVPSSCRAGACQSCLVQVTRGDVPERSQLGLKASLRARGFVLACQAVPASDLEVSLAGAQALELTARIEDVRRLSVDVLRVELRVAGELGYRAGQFLTLVRDDGVSRSYSIASRPEDGDALELHVRVLPQGRMSGWLASGDALGASVKVRGPAGECFYTADKPEQPLVLAGVGSGLAPLWGILRDALHAGHSGAIELWHGARTPGGLYLQAELRALENAHPNFSYRPCALEGNADELRVGKLDQLLLGATSAFDKPRFYLCGDAPLVQGLKRQLFLRGASLREIFADAFVGSAA
jgi:CDP-4-dehydro-6-deoxyglucose reductase, E3